MIKIEKWKKRLKTPSGSSCREGFGRGLFLEAEGKDCSSFLG